MADTWCVYAKEWVTAYTSDENGPAGRLECQAKFDRTWRGKVEGEDHLILAKDPDYPATVRLRLWNLKGEFADPEKAAALAVEVGGVWVTQGGEEEAGMLAYGDRMLPA